MAYKCSVCGGSWDNNCKCSTQDSRDKWIIVCDVVGCEELACGKSIYGFGYLASVCIKHYTQSSQQDKNNAIEFRYAE